jgi:hypothetical protein
VDDRERAVRQRLKADFPHYAAKCLKIIPKDGAIAPLVLNTAQRYLHGRIEAQLARTGRVRAIILKGRQQGCSTYVEARFYWRLSHAFGAHAYILTHEDAATRNLFDMAKRYHQHCPVLVKPSIRASNEKALIFDHLDSGYHVGTAGS